MYAPRCVPRTVPHARLPAKGGSPYLPGSQETCCTVAWGAISAKVLRLSGNSVVADELELSLYNAGLYCNHPSGTWVTYDNQVDFDCTPSQCGLLDGRKAFFGGGAQAWQSGYGTSQCGCCTVNGPRILGSVSEWGVMLVTADRARAGAGARTGTTPPAARGVAINFYGACTMSATFTQPGQTTACQLRLEQQTEYPCGDGTVVVVVRAATCPAAAAIWLRVPAWCRAASASVNGEPVAPGLVTPGTYLRLPPRKWAAGDAIELKLDMRLRAWTDATDWNLPGARPPGRTALYRGPLLLSYDPRFNQAAAAAGAPRPPAVVQSLLATAPRRVPPPCPGPSPALLLEWVLPGGRAFRLCDFASAGLTGRSFYSWLDVTYGGACHSGAVATPTSPFTKANPSRTFILALGPGSANCAQGRAPACVPLCNAPTAPRAPLPPRRRPFTGAAGGWPGQGKAAHPEPTGGGPWLDVDVDAPDAHPGQQWAWVVCILMIGMVLGWWLADCVHGH